MFKRKKLVYGIGSVVIGLSAILLIYIFLIFIGVLRVTSNKIVISSKSRIKEYDGNVLTCEEYEILSGKLKDGDHLEMLFSGKQKEIGESENTYVAVILDSNNTDVTDKYEVVEETGTLTVIQRNIVIQTQNMTKEYDGEPLTCPNYEVVSGSLIQGHQLKVTKMPSITNVMDNVPNALEFQLLDQNQSDVSYNYKIEYDYGTLAITPRKLQATTSSAEKEYDGEPLTSPDCFIDPSKLLEGDEIVEQWAERSETGITPDQGVDNDKVHYKIVNALGEDVTSNYELVVSSGKLNVRKRKIYFYVSDKIVSYNAEEQTFNPNESETDKEYIQILTDSFLEGHHWQIVFDTIPTITNASKMRLVHKDSSFSSTTESLPICYYSMKVLTEDNEDVSNYYQFITRDNATVFEVEPLSVKIEIKNFKLSYTGKDLVVPEENSWENKSKESIITFMENHNHTISVSQIQGSIRTWSDGEPDGEVSTGRVTTTIKMEDITISDEEGNPITSNYKIEVKDGYIQLVKKKLYVRATSKIKEAQDDSEILCWEDEDITVDGQPVEGEIVDHAYKHEDYDKPFIKDENIEESKSYLFTDTSFWLRVYDGIIEDKYETTENYEIIVLQSIIGIYVSGELLFICPDDYTIQPGQTIEEALSNIEILHYMLDIYGYTIKAKDEEKPMVKLVLDDDGRPTVVEATLDTVTLLTEVDKDNIQILDGDLDVTKDYKFESGNGYLEVPIDLYTDYIKNLS